MGGHALESDRELAQGRSSMRVLAVNDACQQPRSEMNCRGLMEIKLDVERALRPV
ncbi:MAG: hypothetical protein GX491_22575 [Chloroflexi bacterium]|nr:hypothetical protein [Chloroflexota bacterium]